MSSAVDRLTASLSDRYHLERELGQGGMATVYLAEDLKHARKVAIKVLHPELSAVIGGDRFLAEIKVTASLQHPHILGLIDSGEVDGLLYYVMPFVDGETLRGRLTREKQLPIDDAIRLSKEVASALDYAHRHGVVHRDIKPENILLQDGQALVADFGIALAVQQAGGSRMTQTGMSLGTPAYMSPEQAMGERDIGARSDVYALGAMTYEMLTGEPPFTGPNSQAIVAKVLTETPPPLRPKRPTVSAAVEHAVLVALQKLPADRYGSAKEFVDALDAKGGSYAATVATAATRLPHPPRLPRLAAIAATALISAATTWGVLRLGARGAPSGTTWQYLSLGDGPALQIRLPGLALSPDATNLVYAGARPPFELWLKRRRQLQATPITGTDGGIYPTFSPDGAWIAFIADGRLKKIRPDGGAPITLSDSAFATFGGAAWLDDGTLVYVGPSITEFSRVSEAGGAVTRALSDPALAGLGIGSPTPLPGARGVLFTVCNSGCVTMALHVLDLRTGRYHKLLDDVAIGWYLPIGQLLYLRRDGTALMAPFDLDRLDISGPATPALEGVFARLGTTYLAWSPTGTLVYLQGSGNANELDVVRVMRDGTAEPIDSAWHGGFNSFAPAPDGRQMAIGAGLASGTLAVWIKQLDRGPFTRLTFGGQDRRPAWSPDGKLVAFIRDTLGGSTVFARRADGSTAAQLLARFDRAVQEVTWSPDGRWIVARTDNGAAGLGDIVGVRTSGDTSPVSLVESEFTELHPAVSPDSRWLAYTSNESGSNEVFVRPFPATTGGRWQVSTSGGEQPRWSADGRELFYLDLVTNELRAAQLRLAPAFEVVERRRLFGIQSFQIDPYHQSYDVLPGGRGFIFMRPRALAETAVQPVLVMAENWFADLRSRLKR